MLELYKFLRFKPISFFPISFETISFVSWDWLESSQFSGLSTSISSLPAPVSSPNLASLMTPYSSLLRKIAIWRCRHTHCSLGISFLHLPLSRLEPSCHGWCRNNPWGCADADTWNHRGLWWLWRRPCCLTLWLPICLATLLQTAKVEMNKAPTRSKLCAAHLFSLNCGSRGSTMGKLNTSWFASILNRLKSQESVKFLDIFRCILGRLGEISIQILKLLLVWMSSWPRIRAWSHAPIALETSRLRLMSQKRRTFVNQKQNAQGCAYMR